MEHSPTSSTLEDSARKFKLALAAIDRSLPGLDRHLARVLEATAAEVIASARDEKSCRLAEANRLMTTYRVKAHALDRELDARALACEVFVIKSLDPIKSLPPGTNLSALFGIDIVGVLE